MPAELADSIQNINCENTPNQRPVDTLAYTYLVDQLGGGNTNPNSHIGATSATARHDDSDEDKDEDCGNIETIAPGGRVIHKKVSEKWPTEHSYHKEEEEEAQEEERRHLW